MSEKTAVTITIAGDQYHIRSEATPEYTRECARYVDASISEIMKSSRSVMEPHKAAILTALSLADQLFQVRRDLEQLQEQNSETANKLTSQIEAKLGTFDLAARP